MTTIKFTADVEGNNADELAEKARLAANDFFRDLPDVPVFKEASVTFDPAWYQSRVEEAVKEADEKVKAYREAHKDEEGFEDIEAVPAEVFKYTGYFEFEYEVKTTKESRTLNDVWAEQDAATGTKPRVEESTKYQDAF